MPRTKSGTPVDPNAALPGPFTVRDYETKEGDYWIDCDNWTGPFLQPRSRGRSLLGGTIATVHYRGAGGFSVRKTAILLATSWDLLAICEKFAMPKNGAGVACMGLGDELQAAIAKAKGGAA